MTPTWAVVSQARSRVWNHHIQGPARFWSKDGPDDEVLQALAQRRFDELPRIVASVEEQRRQQEADLAGSLAHLPS